VPLPSLPPFLPRVHLPLLASYPHLPLSPLQQLSASQPIFRWPLPQQLLLQPQLQLQPLPQPQTWPKLQPNPIAAAVPPPATAFFYGQRRRPLMSLAERLARQRSARQQLAYSRQAILVPRAEGGGWQGEAVALAAAHEEDWGEKVLDKLVPDIRMCAWCGKTALGGSLSKFHATFRKCHSATLPRHVACNLPFFDLMRSDKYPQDATDEDKLKWVASEGEWWRCNTCRAAVSGSFDSSSDEDTAETPLFVPRGRWRRQRIDRTAAVASMNPALSPEDRELMKRLMAVPAGAILGFGGGG